MSGAWDEFGGIGSQLRFLSTRLEACVGADAEVMAWLADEEYNLLARAGMGRGVAGPREVRQIIREPGRDRRLGVADQKGRTHQIRRPQVGRLRNKRSIPSPSQGSREGAFRGHSTLHADRKTHADRRPERLGHLLLKGNPLKSARIFPTYFRGAWGRRAYLPKLSSTLRRMFPSGARSVGFLCPSSHH